MVKMRCAFCVLIAVLGLSAGAAAQSTGGIAGVVVDSNEVIVLTIAALLLVALTFIVQRTRVGTAMRAVAFNPQAAALMGVNISSIISFTFGLGSALMGELSNSRTLSENGVVVSVVPTKGGGMASVGVAF